jgi:uncharacterized iron-regulated protein
MIAMRKALPGGRSPRWLTLLWAACVAPLAAGAWAAVAAPAAPPAGPAAAGLEVSPRLSPEFSPQISPEFSPAALAEAMRRAPVVLLGEVHDNAAQHATRAQALRLLLQGGARPALAFEQFDRGLQAQIDQVRRESGAGVEARVDRLVALGKGGWNWDLYRPFLRAALEYDLPIVAADLSRADAMRVAQGGFAAVFDGAAIERFGLDRLPASLQRAQEQAVEAGHCHQMPESMLPPIARAQIARDATLAWSIEPFAARGVVLLTGNGHVRRDIGVPHFLPAPVRARLVGIGLIEGDAPALQARDVNEAGQADAQADADAGPADAYDVAFFTPVQSRPDPCAALHFGAHDAPPADKPPEPARDPGTVR